jgi:multicopper oxidase
VNDRMNRRRFLGLVGAGASLALGGASLTERTDGAEAASGGLRLDAEPVRFDLGKARIATWGYNNRVPGPIIRLKEGQQFRALVRNRLKSGTTVHWHGLPVPNAMDGVPGVTQDAIPAGGSYLYQYTVPVSGTYMYHSHFGLQLDKGLLGALIIQPKREILSYDRDITLVIDDWADGVPAFNNTLTIDGSDRYECSVPTIRQVSGQAVAPMSVGGNGFGKGGPVASGYPYYLVNGRPASHPFTISVRRGDAVRLRLVNPSAATVYRVALQGHRMRVTHADGQPVQQVEVDAIRLAPGERYDVLVKADNPGAWQLAFAAEGTSDIGRAVFQYAGVKRSLPAAGFHPRELKGKLLDPRALRLHDSVSVPVPDGTPDRIIRLKLGPALPKYSWTIDGKGVAENSVIDVRRGEHVRFLYSNGTKDVHPMHLHGHFVQVQNGTGNGPMRDTVVVNPSGRATMDWIADNPGTWVYHCHNLYHMTAGMMLRVRVS